MSTFVVLQHVACEPPAAYEDVLRARGHEVVRVMVADGEPLPELDGHAGIVAMGAPMSVRDVAEHDWLGPELDYIATAVRAGAPYWGVCFGAQLLAGALGAEVSRGPEAEVGVLPVELTAAAAGDPVFGGLPATPARRAVALGHVRAAGRRGAPGGVARVSQPGVPLAPRLRPPVPPRGARGAGRAMAGDPRVRRRAARDPRRRCGRAVHRGDPRARGRDDRSRRRGSSSAGSTRRQPRETPDARRRRREHGCTRSDGDAPHMLNTEILAPSASRSPPPLSGDVVVTRPTRSGTSRARPGTSRSTSDPRSSPSPPTPTTSSRSSTTPASTACASRRRAPATTPRRSARSSDTILLQTQRMRGVEIDADGADRPRRRPARSGTRSPRPRRRARPAPRSPAPRPTSASSATRSAAASAGSARKHGLAANSVTAIELVTADGELVRATADEHADLFWALRGGGGNFGVVTALEFRLFPYGEVYAGMLLFPCERAGEVLRAWRDWTRTAPDEVTTSCGCCTCRRSRSCPSSCAAARSS